MTELKKQRIKSVLKYTWPLYLVMGFASVLVLNIIFHVAHPTPAYKTLTLFVSGEVTDAKKLKNDMMDKYQEKELKSFSCISSKPSDANYNQKLTIPGYASADVLIIPVSKLNNVVVSDFALDLSDELINSFYQGYELYKKDDVNYGIKVNKEIVKEYITLPEEECYLLLNGKSQNLGDYSKKPVKEHDMALNVVKDWGM